MCYVNVGIMRPDEYRIYMSLKCDYHKYPVSLLWASWMMVKAAKLGRITDTAALALFQYVIHIWFVYDYTSEQSRLQYVYVTFT